MPPILMSAFPEKPGKNLEQYTPLFDGQCWNVNPTDYNYDVEDIKKFETALKKAARAQNCHVRTFVTLDDHVILQRRPDGYVPVLRGRKRATTVSAPGETNGQDD